MSFSLKLRPPAPGPYRASGRVLALPTTTLSETARILRTAGSREACCLWLGTRSAGGIERVEAIAVPHQTNRPLNYAIDPQGMQAVNAVAKEHRWTLIANVHSHPGVDPEHSEYDDAMMPSRKALSVVIPHYGRWPVENWPRGLGVHEFVDDYWHLLTPGQVATRAILGADRDVHVWDLR